MNGHKTKYLYYEDTGRSIVTIPRAILDALNLNWDHKNEIKIVFKEIEGQKGLFLFKPQPNKEE
jgi:hypothetical protein